MMGYSTSEQLLMMKSHFLYQIILMCCEVVILNVIFMNHSSIILLVSYPTKVLWVCWSLCPCPCICTVHGSCDQLQVTNTLIHPLSCLHGIWDEGNHGECGKGTHNVILSVSFHRVLDLGACVQSMLLSLTMADSEQY